MCVTCYYTVGYYILAPQSIQNIIQKLDYVSKSESHQIKDFTHNIGYTLYTAYVY